MKPFATLPPNDCKPLLPTADFADAFALDVPEEMDAPEATSRAVNRMPAWITRLVMLRSAVVAPLGLKTGASQSAAQSAGPQFGSFPVVSSSPERVVLGFDDRHLDFRVVVDVEPAPTGHRVTITTLVARHNLFGRLYLAAVMPFHKLVVPAMLVQVAR